MTYYILYEVDKNLFNFTICIYIYINIYIVLYNITFKNSYFYFKKYYFNTDITIIRIIKIIVLQRN
jgi:hypothetical protein